MKHFSSRAGWLVYSVSTVLDVSMYLFVTVFEGRAIDCWESSATALPCQGLTDADRRGHLHLEHHKEMLNATGNSIIRLQAQDGTRASKK